MISKTGLFNPVFKIFNKLFMILFLVVTVVKLEIMQNMLLQHIHHLLYYIQIINLTSHSAPGRVLTDTITFKIYYMMFFDILYL